MTGNKIKAKFDKLKFSSKDIREVVNKYGIINQTFYRDMKTDPGIIPAGRLYLYSLLLKCPMEEFLKKPKEKRDRVGEGLSI